MSPLERRARTLLVDALLEELAHGRRELYRRTTHGVRGIALEPLKRDLDATRRRLADLHLAHAE